MKALLEDECFEVEVEGSWYSGAKGSYYEPSEPAGWEDVTADIVIYGKDYKEIDRWTLPQKWIDEHADEISTALSDASEPDPDRYYDERIDRD